jgi:hypothetical protein
MGRKAIVRQTGITYDARKAIIRDRALSSESCIVAQFRRHSELDDLEVSLSIALEKDVQEFSAGTVLSKAGEKAGRFFSLHSDWACATRLLSDGQRQVLDIFLAGQIMGMRDIGFSHTQTELKALTDVRACPFPSDYLDEIFERSPRLARIFFMKLVRVGYNRVTIEDLPVWWIWPMTNRIQAILVAAPAIPLSPRAPAMIATIRTISAHDSMVSILYSV